MPSDVLLAGAFSGAIAGFLTNSVELLAVNKQTDCKFSVRKFLQEKGSIHCLLFQGVGARTFYYSLQACLLFYLLEKLKIYLSVDFLDED